MGYELNKLMRQFGVSTPGTAAYSGPAAPVIPVMPAALREGATDEERAAFDQQKSAAEAYARDPSQFNELMRKYQLGQREYDQHRRAFQERVANTPQYLDAQYQAAPSAGLRYVTATPDLPASIQGGTEEEKRRLYQNLRNEGFSDALIRQRATDVIGPQADPYWDRLTAGVVSTNTNENKGIGVDAYNKNIRDWFAKNPNATPQQVREEMARYGISGYDVAQARGGSMWGTPLASPTYGAVPASIGALSQQGKMDYYNRLRDLGYTDADVRSAAERTFGAIPQAHWDALKSSFPVPDISRWPGADAGPPAPIRVSGTGVTMDQINSLNIGGDLSGFRDYMAMPAGTPPGPNAQTWINAGFTMPSFGVVEPVYAARGGSVRDLAQKYNTGGSVRKFQLGGAQGEPEDPMETFLRDRGLLDAGMAPAAAAEPEALRPVTASPAVQPVTLPPAATTPVSPAADDLMGMVSKYLGRDSAYGEELKAARTRADTESAAFQKLISDATKPDGTAPDKTEMYFRLAAAFGAPTKTGHFAENLGMVGRELGEYAKDKRAAAKADKQLRLQLGLEAQKLRTQTAREDLATLRTLAGEEMKDKRAVLQEYLKSGRPQSEAGKVAQDMGLKPGTPEYNKAVNDYVERKLESGELYKQAMVNIAAGNLALGQSRETRAVESAAKLTPAEVKLKSEAETTVGSLEDAMGSLKRAYSLNPNTFEGTWAAIAQQKVLEQTDPKDPRVLATREQRNLLGKGAIERLKAAFGGNPTEGERAALLELEGLDAKSKEERARIIRNTYKLLQARFAREKKRLNDITAGLYRETTPAAGDLD